MFLICSCIPDNIPDCLYNLVSPNTNVGTRLAPCLRANLIKPFLLFRTRLICLSCKLSISGMPPTISTAASPPSGRDKILVKLSLDEATAPNRRKNSLKKMSHNGKQTNFPFYLNPGIHKFPSTVVR